MVGVQQGELDNALRGLKEGNAFRRKRENRRSIIVSGGLIFFFFFPNFELLGLINQ